MDGKNVIAWAIGVGVLALTVYIVFRAGSAGVSAGKK